MTNWCRLHTEHRKGLAVETYLAVTALEKAKALRLETKGTVRIQRERDSHVVRVGGKNRLIGREIYVVERIAP